MKKAAAVLAVVGALILGWGIQVKADGTTGFSLIIQSAGTTKGGAVTLNCDGVTVACALSGGVVTLSGIAGGGGISQLTGDVTAGPGTGSQAATVVGLKSVPFCTGYTPATTQVLTYTTASSPNPCYTATTPGAGASVSFGLFASLPSCTTSQFIYYATDAGVVAYCNGSSSVRYKYGQINATPITLASFSGFNAPTSATVPGGVTLTGTAGGAANLQGYLQAVPATPYVQIGCFDAVLGQSFANAGMFWSNGTNTSTSGMVQFQAIVLAASSPANFALYSQLVNATGVTSGGSVVSATNFNIKDQVCYAMQDDGTTALKYAISYDAQTWRVISTTTRTAFITPSNVGFYVNTGSSGTVPSIHLFSWQTVAGTLF